MIAFLLLFALAAPGAKTAPELDALIERANSLPPEFAADALIRIAGSGKLADAARQRALLVEAFQRASGAQQPYPRTDPARDPKLALLRQAYAQELDALSLQSRAVRALLPLDRAKARELFSGMPPLRLPALSCADALVYEVAPFYQALGDVFRDGFTAKEIAQDEPLKLLLRYAGSVQAPAQIAPLAHVLAAARLKPAQLEAAVAVFSSALKSVSADARSFSISEAAGAAEPQAIEELARACRQAQIPAFALLDAYRSYLVRHLTGPRCASPERVMAGMALGMVTPQSLNANEDAVSYFNAHLSGEQIKPLNEDEVRPARIEERQPRAAECTSEECRQMGARYKRLVQAEDGTPLTAQQRASTEWQVRLKEFLGALAGWRPEDGDGFRQKCAVYSELLGLAVNGPDREEVLRALLVFLQDNPYGVQHRLEWFLPVNGLIGRVFGFPAGLERVAAQLRATADPVISFYAQLEQIAPRPPSRFLGLL